MSSSDRSIHERAINDKSSRDSLSWLGQPGRGQVGAGNVHTRQVGNGQVQTSLLHIFLKMEFIFKKTKEIIWIFTPFKNEFIARP